MRLSKQEINVICSVTKNLDFGAQIFLYGSRLDDHLKGGDIDLLIVSEKLSFSDKIQILSEIKTQIGEQKIDILIRNKENLNSDPFVKEIFSHAQQLN